ncbi:MAG: SDR family NAD(P)-dependent oxidoreductase, partial [Alphaproteobacteria bacterium]
MLSAKNDDRLHASAQRLLDWLRRSHSQPARLPDIAYTLQVGRSAMEERLGIVARSLDELERKLGAFVSGAAEAGDIDRGVVSPEDQDTASVAPQVQAAELIADGHDSEVLQLWVKGGQVDWNALWGERKPKRISRPIETLICFASRKETRQALNEFVQATDRQIRLVFVADAASEYAQTSGENVVSGDPQSFQKLFERLKAAYGKADAVLYWWPLEDQRYISDFSPPACIIQAIGKSRMATGALILAAQGDDGQERCYWEALIGLERSASMVLPDTAVAVIYEAAERPVQLGDLRRWAENTWAELQAEKIQSSLYRDSKRHVCRVEPVDISASPPVLRKGGTYLITGGMGGLGYLFAEHLVRNYAARIVLTGRSPLNEAKQKKLDALAAAGEVVYWQADVCDEADMQACLEALKARFGMLHGVIHAAGAESWQNLHDNDLTQFLNVLEPKIRGTLVLDEVLRSEPIDFLCCFSSSSAVIGDLGACSYAMGNRFQMAHARWRQERRFGGRTQAINWPLWSSGGMQIGDTQSTEFYLKSTGQRLLEADEGKRIFETLLGQYGPQYLVMCGESAKIQQMLKLGSGGSSSGSGGGGE